jgi:hypothetical protein
VSEVVPRPEPRFIQGLDLCQAFFAEAVEPVMQAKFPQLPYSAALIGSGSEVLGFDTEMSSDHHWGPRVMLFVGRDDLIRYKTIIAKTFSESLPRTFRGYPTGYTQANAHDKGVQLLDHSQEGAINHRIEVNTIGDFIIDFLGFDPGDGAESGGVFPITAADWLTFPEQKLRAITAGRVFHDRVGLERMRKQFAYYPHDVWLYLLASCWSSIEQNEHLMGRAGSVGDEIGSALIAAHLVRDIMRLSFLMTKSYAPYPKWYGTAFAKLAAAETLAPLLQKALVVGAWEERQIYLSQAYEYLAILHNLLCITAPVPEKVQLFYDRPFLVISMGVFSQAICQAISDPALKQLAKKPLIGSIDQYSDSTDLLSDRSWRKALMALYSTSSTDDRQF